jgi:methyltransferase (TIGR00027 family)
LEQREPLIRNISDTARWAAVYRARESERKDALFRDPFARRLAGERGEQIADALPKGNRNTWSWVMRTWLFDQLIAEQISQGVDLVVNLAAGLDARPYRLALPSSLTRVEVDLPELIDFKEAALEGEKSSCVLERIRLDLSDRDARRELFEKLGRRGRKALILTEGLLTYLTSQEVGSLAEDLARPPSSSVGSSTSSRPVSCGCFSETGARTWATRARRSNSLRWRGLRSSLATAGIRRRCARCFKRRRAQKGSPFCSS